MASQDQDGEYTKSGVKSQRGCVAKKTHMKYMGFQREKQSISGSLANWLAPGMIRLAAMFCFRSLT